MRHILIAFATRQLDFSMLKTFIFFQMARNVIKLYKFWTKLTVEGGTEDRANLRSNEHLASPRGLEDPTMTLKRMRELPGIKAG